jgi:hypothetical protein
MSMLHKTMAMAKRIETKRISKKANPVSGEKFGTKAAKARQSIKIPVTPPIHAHSIIAVKGDDLPPKGGDGVVKYTSAHVEGVESELVVRSGHSCQGKPSTIEEVRRILLRHLDGVTSERRTGRDGAATALLPHPVPYP